MNSTRTSLARIISTGFVVTLVFSVCLFWMNAVLRKIGREELVSRQGMRLTLPLDLGDKKLADPNLAVSAPHVVCEFSDHRSAESDIFLDRLLGYGLWITGYQEDPWQFGYDLDRVSVNDARHCKAEWHAQQGLIVIEQSQTLLKGKGVTPRIRYVGPKGFGESPDKALGRFYNPLLCCGEASSTLFVYDKDLKKFFRIDCALKKVTSKSWAGKSIVAASSAYLGKFPYLLQMHAYGAFRWETDQEMKARLEKTLRDPRSLYMRDATSEANQEFRPEFEEEKKDSEEQGNRLQVPFGPRVHGAGSSSGPWAMDDQGTIYLVDRDTLLLSPPKGQLPSCGIEEAHTPSRLLSYRAMPLFVDGQYFGLAVASLSRDGSEAVMVLFDANGKEVAQYSSYLKPRDYRYGQVMAYARNVLDFAQPLVFSAASSLWGPRTEAIAGYRSLFVLPMSTPARIAGDKTLKASDRVGTLFMWNVGTWIVGLLLAIVVVRDLKQRGMSSTAQHAWLFACMGFGWIAVITYLLTRPGLQFVTCTGCGCTRRTDQAHCLHCQADWAMRDLQVPGWRVVD